MNRLRAVLPAAFVRLFSDFELPPGDTVPVWIQARDNPGDWIAESFTPVE